MKTLYLDCGMGAAGDMLTAALLELLPDRERFVQTFNALGIPGVEMLAEESFKCGLRGTHVSMRIHGHEEDEPGAQLADHHITPGEIRSLLASLPLPEGVRRDACAVYDAIAAAEAAVHGTDAEHIHFHEVGSLDAVADVTAVCLLMHELAVGQVIASPVHVGSGQLRCAHGLLPVPAPATAELLKGVPIYGGEIRGELCTPTGAALLRHFVSRFAPMPPLRVEAIGRGMGRKDFPAANCLTAYLGESGDAADTILEFSCNVDDMTGEEIAFCCERLFDAGAREVYTVPIAMKKGRPGTLIRFLCTEDKRGELLQTLFRHSSTLGVRELPTRREILRRESRVLETEAGPVRLKVSAGHGVTTEKMEFDDLRRIALERGLSLREARRLAEEAQEK